MYVKLSFCNLSLKLGKIINYSIKSLLEQKQNRLYFIFRKILMKNQQVY